MENILPLDAAILTILQCLSHSVIIRLISCSSRKGIVGFVVMEQ